MGRIALKKMSRTPVRLAFLKNFTVKEHLGNITVPALALVSEGDGETLIRQAKQFIDGISSSRKALHVFTMKDDRSVDHCQLDNRSRGAQVMFDFFDEVFGYHPVF